MPLIRKPAGASAPPPALNADEVLKMLVGGTDDERWTAARNASGVTGGTEGLGKALIRESNVRVREAMFTSLARIGTAQSIEVILTFLRSEDAHVRTEALDALESAGSAAWPYLPVLLKDDDADVRILGCELARSMPAREASPLVCTLIESEPEANVCASAVEVLAEIGGAEALPALERCRERFRESDFLAFSIKFAADRIRGQSQDPSA